VATGPCLLYLCAGLNSRVPTAHSVLLSSVVGPLGLLSHELTKVSHEVPFRMCAEQVKVAG
jgi:hypothetical protein